jgi:acetyltransferase-like isoleucine patch superfamily enzyme
MPITDADIGADVGIFYPDLVNIYGCRIEGGSRIGPFVEIQRGAHIGPRCKISSHSFICAGVSIGAEVFVGHGVVFTNEIYPEATNADGTLKRDGEWELVETVVEARASIGSNATIVAGITIGHGALVGAGAVVTRDVPAYAIVAGSPARVVGDTREKRARSVRSPRPVPAEPLQVA